MPFLGPAIETAPRAIIFDVGRVIIGVDLSRSMEAIGQLRGLNHTQVMKELVEDKHWPDWQEGRMSPRDWHAHLTKKFQFTYTFEEFCAIWNNVLDPQQILPDSLFERLAEKCTLALLSNTDPIHVAHFESTYSFVRHFPSRIYSCRVGMSKPAAMIYHHALREVSAMPDEALFIDDLSENVRAAGALSINAFQFTSADDLLAAFSRMGLWSI